MKLVKSSRGTKMSISSISTTSLRLVSSFIFLATLLSLRLLLVCELGFSFWRIFFLYCEFLLIIRDSRGLFELWNDRVRRLFFLR